MYQLNIRYIFTLIKLQSKFCLAMKTSQIYNLKKCIGTLNTNIKKLKLIITGILLGVTSR